MPLCALHNMEECCVLWLQSESSTSAVQQFMKCVSSHPAKESPSTLNPSVPILFVEPLVRSFIHECEATQCTSQTTSEPTYTVGTLAVGPGSPLTSFNTVEHYRHKIYFPPQGLICHNNPNRVVSSFFYFTIRFCLCCKIVCSADVDAAVGHNDDCLHLIPTTSRSLCLQLLQLSGNSLHQHMLTRIE